MNSALPAPVPQEELPTVIVKRRWRRTFLALGVLVFLVVATWVGVLAVQALLKTKPRLARAVGMPISVKVATVKREEIAEIIGGTTTGQPFLAIAINAAVSEGRVSTVKVEIGQLVKSGDLLLEFETSVFREVLERSLREIKTARAELRKLEAEQETRLAELRQGVAAGKERLVYLKNATDTAGKNYQRLKTLMEQKVVALADLEQAKVKWDEAASALAGAEVELTKAENDLKNYPVVTQFQIEAIRVRLATAEQALARAQRDMENTAVRAPQAGVIAERQVDPGEWVKNGAPLLALHQFQPIYAVAQIEQEKLPYISLGQTAEVVFDSYPTRVVVGKVAKIDPTVDPTKRTFKVFSVLENSSSELKPGMAAFTRFKNVRHVTLLPRLAMINPTGAPSVAATVFVVEDFQISARKVKVGKAEGPGWIEVLGGISPGEVVVIHGQKDLNAGDRVLTELVEAPKKEGKR